MHANMSLLEGAQIVSGFLPRNLAAGANTADVVSLKNYRRCTVIFHKGIGSAPEDPTLTILQGTSIAFSTNKPLLFTTVYVKQDLTKLIDEPQWTKVTQTAANTYTNDTLAESAALIAVEFKAEDLDIANDYHCIRASVADVGSLSQLGALFYILHDPIHSTAPEDMASAQED